MYTIKHLPEKDVASQQRRDEANHSTNGQKNHQQIEACDNTTKDFGSASWQACFLLGVFDEKKAH